MTLFIKAKDIQRLESLSDINYASRKMKDYLSKLKKKKGSSLTVFEYAEVKGVRAEDVIKAMQ